MRSIAVHLLTSRQPRQRGRPDLDFATVDKIDRGIEEDPVAVFDAGAHLDGLIEVTRHGYGTNARNAALNDGDAETVSVEDDRLGRDDQRRCRSRDLQLNGAINPGDNARGSGSEGTTQSSRSRWPEIGLISFPGLENCDPGLVPRSR
jgi:hypothetical protein